MVQLGRKELNDMDKNRTGTLTQELLIKVFVL